MIHYHGGPITPDVVAADVWTARHAMVSWGTPEQIELAAEVSQSFCADKPVAGQILKQDFQFIRWGDRTPSRMARMGRIKLAADPSGQQEDAAE